MKSPRIVSAEEAVASIGKEQMIYFSGNANQPEKMAKAVQNDPESVSGSTVVQALTLDRGWVAPHVMKHARVKTPFAGYALRDAINAGHADIIHTHLSLWSDLLENEYRPDVAIVQVSPPDEGFCSLGLDAGLSHPAVMAAKRVIGVVNSNMPCFHRELLLGEWDSDKNMPLQSGCAVPYDLFDMIVETDDPLMTHPMGGELDEVSQKIGRHIAEFIRDGDTLQLGIGSVPDAVLECLDGFQDLGLHTEMACKGAYILWEKGVITGKKKNLLRGKMVLGFVLGDEEMYAALGHPDFCFLPQHWVNDPRIIAKNQNMVSVNSALAVSLPGDVCASSIGPKVYSGDGGQRDFVLGARRSKGGRSFIALPSTYVGKDGKLASRIVPLLPYGSHVTTSSSTVDHIVTEYGAVRLAGKTLRERAELLIGIAHPDFQGELEQAARILDGVMLH